MAETQRVLVVEDEPEIRDGVQRWLGAAGFDTLFPVGAGAGRSAGPLRSPLVGARAGGALQVQ